MKKIVVLGTVLLATAIVAVVGYGVDDVSSAQVERSLPATLDQLYPPQAQGPMYLMAMQELNIPLAGLACDLLEGDTVNAQGNFQKFKSQYARVSQLVPEWASQYPDAPLNALGTALQSGAVDRVMGALDQIDKVCHDCHVRYMPAAHFRYHWDDFRSITLTDPLTKESVSFKQFKLMINTNMVGIGNDLEQGQMELAKRNGQQLAARFDALSDVCVICHDIGQKYFTSDDIRAQIDSLLYALNEEPASPSRIGELVRGIGTESCFKCHLVHIPAAYSKY